MPDLNVLAILVATVVTLIVSGAYYGVLGTRLARLSPVYAAPAVSAAATIPVELVRGLVVAVVVTGLAGGLGLDSLGQGLLLAVVLWVGFPVVLLWGSVFHERVPLLLATIHAGDWLLKLAVIAGIVTVW